MNNPFKKKFVQNIPVFLCAIFAAFVISEGVLRFLSVDPGTIGWAAQYFCISEDAGKIMKPRIEGFQFGHIEMKANEMGYRDDSWDQKKGVFRLMLLGDSLGFGWGCPFEKTAGQVLEQKSESAVFNLSIPGDGPTDYYRRYQRHKTQIQPDIVVLLTYVNDYFMGSGSVTAPSKETISQRQEQPFCRPYMGDRWKILNYSYLLRLLNQWRLAHEVTLNPWSSRKELIRKSFTEDVRFFTSLEAQGNASFDILSQLIQDIQKDGVKILLGYIPPAYAVESEILSEVGGVFNLKPGDLKYNFLEDRLKGFSNQLGVSFLSFTRVLRESEETLYFKSDFHLNEKGQELVGKKLAEVIHEL